ncbi:MAG: NnrS family protein [Candidatus Omnitrophica bacterium]|nr:NnrS family protein [Candidatus Omnitrophota bacterium]
MVQWGDLRREPFRVLFPLAVVFGCAGVGHWLGYALGWRESYSGFYHASLQVGAYMTCFIAGFLMTALPRFAAAQPASNLELGLALGLLGMQAAALWEQRWMLAEGCLAGLLVLLAVFAGRRFAAKPASVAPPTEFVWIPFAILCGLAGSVLLILGQSGIAPSWVIGMARPMVQQGFLLGIILGVAGFMAPRLMGRETLRAATLGVTPGRAQAIRRRRIRLHGLAGLVFLATFWIEGTGAVGPAYLLRAAVFTGEFLWTSQLHRPPAPPDRYVRLLWLSIWLMAAGLWGAGIVPRFRVMMLHLVFLGGFSLMTFAVGTMVVLSHAGEAHRLRQPLWVFRVVEAGLGGALAARVLAELAPTAFFPWLGVAAVCWLAAGLGWLVFILPYVARPLAPDAFERVHEEAKRRLLRPIRVS